MQQFPFDIYVTKQLSFSVGANDGEQLLRVEESNDTIDLVEKPASCFKQTLHLALLVDGHRGRSIDGGWSETTWGNT